MPGDTLLVASQLADDHYYADEGHKKALRGRFVAFMLNCGIVFETPNQAEEAMDLLGTYLIPKDQVVP